MVFSEKFSDNEIPVSIEPNSLYTMSHDSQSFWSHRINRCSEYGNKDTRYSLTFRSINKRFRDSTIILGDSNTCYLKFAKPGSSDNKRTFGYLMPGQHIEAYELDEIDPYTCVGYSNIVIMCAINDIRKDKVKDFNDVKGCFSKFTTKLQFIQQLCPRAKIIVAPCLPTKHRLFNRKVADYNRLLYDYVKQMDNRIRLLDFKKFADGEGFLAEHLGRYFRRGDLLHLGSSGIRLLATTIRGAVFDRRVDSRQYSDVVKPGGTHHESTQNGLQPFVYS